MVMRTINQVSVVRRATNNVQRINNANECMEIRMEISNFNSSVKVLQVSDLIVIDVSISEILAATYRFAISYDPL